MRDKTQKRVPPAKRTPARTQRAGLSEGERRARRGIALAAGPHEIEICRDMLRVWDAMLGRPEGTGTTDDAVDDLAAAHADRGAWRGSVTRRCKATGLVDDRGHVTSARLHRGSGPVKLLRLRDRAAALAYRPMLVAALAAARQAAPVDAAPPHQRTLFGEGGEVTP